MSEQESYEKGEKESGTDEKSQEKTREKEDEKRWEEKWRRDPLSSIAWAVILIWAGVAFLISNLGLMNWFGPIGLIEPWSLIFAGAGLILLAVVVARLVLPEYRRPVVGTLILALVFLGIGLGDTLGAGVVWALIVIGIGVTFLLTGILRGRE
jgi:hypothetical protein